MSDYFTPLVVGSNITELPKSTLPASAADDAGHYPFFCSSAEVKTTTTWLQENPAVLMGTGGVASVNYGEAKFAYSTDTWGFRSNNPKLNTKFLFRKIQQYLPLIDYSGFEGSGLRHLRKDFVKKLKIDVPYPTVQSRMVEIIDGYDRAIEITEALIKKNQQIKAGLMHDLFTRGIGADGQLRPPREQAPELYQQTSIGWIPKEWTLRRLDEMSIKIGDGIHATPNYTDDSEFYFINGNNLDGGFIRIYSNTLCVDEREFKRYAIDLDENTILYSINGTIGNMALYRGERVILGKSAAFIKCRDGNDVGYVFHILNAHYVRSFYEREMTGSTIKNLSLAAIRATPIVMPVCDLEKGRITARLNSISKKVSNERESLDKLLGQKHGLMHDLLTGKVRVKLNEPSPEMAVG